MTARSLRLAFLGDPSSVHLRRWLGRFVTRGHTVALLQPTEARPEDLAQLPDGVERLPFRALPPALGPAGILAARRDLRRHIGAWRPDIVHAHYARRPAWHAWLSGARPYAISVWGSDVLVTDRMTRAGRIATRRWSRRPRAGWRTRRWRWGRAANGCAPSSWESTRSGSVPGRATRACASG